MAEPGARVALATYAKAPELPAEERFLLRPLAELGVAAEPVVWDAADARWRAYDAVIVRSCWDYHLSLDRFFAWLDRLEALAVPVWNPPAMLRWNADKGYLRELGAAGVPVVPTEWIATGSAASLSEVIGARGWSDVVVKPAVSASAYGTWRSSASAAERDEPAFRALVGRGAVLVQPYLPEIEREGEWSFCFFGGRFSHAVLKRPGTGDFRVQLEHGGRKDIVTAPEPLLAQARAVLDGLGETPLYARVDGCAVEGTLWLMELELLEPSLFLELEPEAPDRFARAIAARLTNPSRPAARGATAGLRGC